jgi:hypothetical protein
MQDTAFKQLGLGGLAIGDLLLRDSGWARHQNSTGERTMNYLT